MKILDCINCMMSILLLMLVICGCNQESLPVANSEQNLQETTLSRIADAGLKGQTRSALKKFVEKTTPMQYISEDASFDFEQAYLVPLSESTIQIVVIEKLHNSRSLNVALFGFLRNDEVLPFFVVNETCKLGKNHFRNHLRTVEGQIFLTYEVKNKKIISSKIADDCLSASLAKASPNTAEALSIFNQCVKGWFGYLTDVPSVGLLCMVEGAYCAAFITGNCLAKQVESWF